MENIAEFFRQFTPEFYLSLVVGGLCVLLFSKNKFLEPSLELDRNSPEGQFLVSELTSKRAFLSAYLTYLVGLEGLYLFVCFIGPSSIYGLAGQSNAPEWTKGASVPIGTALAMLGIIPHMPYVDQIEGQWRRTMHRRAQVPTAVRELVDALRQSIFRHGRYRDALRTAPASVFKPTDKDFKERSTSEVNQWARLTALLLRLPTISNEPGVHLLLKSDFLAKYQTWVKMLANDRESLQAQIETSYKVYCLSNPNLSKESLGEAREMTLMARAETIRALLTKVYVYLSCMLLNHKEGIEEGKIRDLFGFESDEQRSLSRTQDSNIIGYSFLAACLCSFAFQVAAPLLGKALPAPLYGWPMEFDNPFLLFISTFPMYGTALGIAYWRRRASPYPDPHFSWPQFSDVMQRLAWVICTTTIVHYYLRSVFVGYSSVVDYFRYVFPNVLPYAVFGMLAALSIAYSKKVRHQIGAVTVALVTVIQLGVLSYYYQQRLADYPDQIVEFESGALIFDLGISLTFVIGFFVAMAWLFNTTARASPTEAKAV